MEKINKLKKIFKKEKIDGYIIPKNDEFFGEYIPHHEDRLKYISGFSGSYGFALILNNKNYLFVDGRYTFQAKEQIDIDMISLLHWNDFYGVAANGTFVCNKATHRWVGDVFLDFIPRVALSNHLSEWAHTERTGGMLQRLCSIFGVGM